MPSVLSLDLPRPKNWQDFESIVLDAQRLRWKAPSLQKNGRPGQAQQGVDVFGPDDIGRRVGIQCKRYATALTLATVEEEAVNAEAFQPTLNTLFIATTNDHDSKLQQQVRLYSDARVAAGKFAVSLLFWEDIVGGLALNPAVFKLHYPTIQLPTAIATDRDRLLAALELGYYGPYLWEYVELTFGEFGWMANADPENVPIIIRLVEQRSQQLLPPADANAILSSLAQVSEIVVEQSKHSEEGWAAVRTLCTRVAMRIKTLAAMPISESNMLEAGRRLGAIYHHVDDAVPADLSEEIRRQLRAVLPAESHAIIDARIARANAAQYPYGYHWAPSIYTCVEREIRYASFA
ncbi:hypothetical protein ACI50E_21150 [Brucella sp. ZJ1_1]|uniref:Restriction endonuclease type IV Mrr domain-containing protein n=2 Tax=Brucella intermedia TaxID=94625 RepID=C4WQ98_9HYPH|nr:hypothetical protein [Brucella intermedia]EEQ94439.1 Hypothetical protein OINT_2001668 [Brucella intermedia LMG 3301]ELT47040.1 hypothetical protein D584_21791 [Brucella intermedia M86]NKB96688.1 hypothetical protein [Brucella intermedia]OOC50590.1 hypothetical protein AS855_21275 [Brucella intermedia M86]SUA87343.1 Uncharacterised protein [Brucella intermedia]